MTDELSEHILTRPARRSTRRLREIGVAVSRPPRAFSIRLVFGYVVAGVFLGGLAWYAVTKADYFEALADVHLSVLVAIALTRLVQLFARSYYLEILSQEIGAKIGLVECVLIVGATNLLSTVTVPGASAAFRAAWLSRRHNVPIGRFAGGVALFVVVWIAISTSFLIIGILAAGPERVARLAVAILVTGGVAAAIAYLMYRGIGCAHQRFGRMIWWTPRLCLTATTTTLVCFVTQAGRFLLAFFAFDAPLSFGGLIALTAAYQMGGTIGLSPGSAGIQETVAVLLVTTIGIDLRDIVVILLTLRAISFVMAILIGATCWCLLAQRRNASS